VLGWLGFGGSNPFAILGVEGLLTPQRTSSLLPFALVAGDGGTPAAERTTTPGRARGSFIPPAVGPAARPSLGSTVGVLGCSPNPSAPAPAPASAVTTPGAIKTTPGEKKLFQAWTRHFQGAKD